MGWGEVRWGQFLFEVFFRKCTVNIVRSSRKESEQKEVYEYAHFIMNI